MGAALAAIPVGEALGGILLGSVLAVAVGAVGAAAVIAFEHAMQNCSCGNAPQFVLSTPNVFRIQFDHEISAQGLASVRLKSTEVTNKQLPYGFTILICKGESQRGPVYHAGLLIEGDFDVGGANHKFLFADRWADGILVWFFDAKQEALGRLQTLLVHDVPLTDCSETPLFQATSCASSIVSFVHEELRREMNLRAFRRQEDLARLGFTNCIVFSVRAGLLLAADVKDQFYAACLAAIHPE